MGCAGSARLHAASASASSHRTPTPVKREIEVQTITIIEPIYVETQVQLENINHSQIDSKGILPIDTEERVDEPELPLKSDTIQKDLKIELEEDKLEIENSADENLDVQVKTNQHSESNGNDLNIQEEDIVDLNKESCTLDSNSNTVNSQELSGEEDEDSSKESPDANEVVQQVRQWLNSSPPQQETSSPKQSCRQTRWEALADVVSELPPRLAVDPVTGQIYSYAPSHPAPRRPLPPPLPPS